MDAIEVDDTNFFDDQIGSINTICPKEAEEKKLKKKLKFYFMNPIEKWQHKQRFPYKLLVQVIKIIIVTMQSYIFAQRRIYFVQYVWSNQIAFSHLFLEGWDPSREVYQYPPPTGNLAIYQMQEFYSAIDFAANSYANLEQAAGSYFYENDDNSISPMKFCYSQYKICDIFGFNESYTFSNEKEFLCKDVYIDKGNLNNFSSEEYFRQNNITIKFICLLEATLSMKLKTVNLRSGRKNLPPNCYKFNVSIYFDNQGQNGQVKYDLNTVTDNFFCKGNINYESTNKSEWLTKTGFNVTVIIFCSISAILCSRSIYRAQKLKKKTVRFFRTYYGRDVSCAGKMEFFNMWYVIMIISDLLGIIGSVLKERIERNDFSGDEWNICSLMLGVGMFLIWFSLLRYLGFFETYNLVVITLKTAFPMIIRFMVCALLLFVGFTISGWLILGPYHMKFRTLSETAQCLFALVNGDDIFATFRSLQPTQSVLLKWFCPIYLYLFVSLFVYVILSLLGSVILDGYETIKLYKTEGFPKNDIQQFADSTSDVSCHLCESSSSLADDLPECCIDSTSLGRICTRLCCLK